MNEKNQRLVIVLAFLCAVSLIGSCGVITLKGYSHAEKMKSIEQKMFEVNRAADVEQTEERSQFWQKAIPWGEDEAERNE